MKSVFLLLCLGCLALRPMPGAAKTVSPAALAANNQGAAAFAAGNFPAAITAFRKAVQLAPDQPVIVESLAASYQKLGRWTEAQALLQAKIKAFRALDQKTELEGALADNHFYWAQKLKEAYQYQEALTHLQAALAVDRAFRPSEVGVDLYALGSVSDDLTQYAKAIDYYQEALKLRQASGDQSGEANVLNNLGSVYDTLGQYANAIDSYGQALAITRALQDSKTGASILTSMGVAWDNAGQPEKAIDLYEQSLKICRELKDREGEAVALKSLGSAYDALGQPAKAISYQELALPIWRELKDREGEASTLNNLGAAYDNLGQYDKATGFYQQALPINRAMGNREGEITTLTNLMDSVSEKSPDLAIWYGKQSVTMLQNIRANLTTLDAQAQKAFVASHEKTYRALAEVLIQQGRLGEALHVLGLLKQEEFFTFLGREVQAAPSRTVPVRLTANEAKWQEQYARLDKDQPLAPFLAGLTKAFQTSAEAGTIPAESEAANLSDAVGKLAAGTVALYTIVEADKVRLILVTSSTQRAAHSPIAAKDLYAKVKAFRDVLQDPDQDPRPLGQELYTLLLGPIEKDLDKGGVKTILWSLDDALRYLPVSALFDGKQYLVERYRNAVFTPASESKIAAGTAVAWRGLGLGVSKEYEDFPALPSVPQELNGIVQGKDGSGILPGTTLLDAGFTQASLTKALVQNAGLKSAFPVVHIATHFNLSARDADSFLLLGDGSHLSLSAIKKNPKFFQGVDLLALSACNTAIEVKSADGREVEGFGALAQRLGAKSVLASLWPVADASTQVLMQNFYRAHQATAGTSKAEALRLAQISLLHGTTLPPTNAPKITRARRAPTPGAALVTHTPFVADAKAPYAHPYFWAPFILIGDSQ